MMFMRYAIDALFLDEGNKAVGVYHSLPPWIGISGWHRDAAKVVELPAGTLKRLGIEAGSTLSVRE